MVIRQLIVLLRKANDFGMPTLRTADCKDREPSVNGPFGKSLIFCPKIPFGDLFLKIILKGSSEF